MRGRGIELELVKQEGVVVLLKQAGIIVVPISYLDSEEEIISILEEVNGVYFAGDSHTAISNP